MIVVSGVVVVSSVVVVSDVIVVSGMLVVSGVVIVSDMMVVSGVVIVSGVVVVSGVIVDTVTYVDETRNVEIAAVTEEKVADGAMESVCTPRLTDDPGTEKDPSGDNAVVGGVVTGRSVAVKARDPSTCGA